MAGSISGSRKSRAALLSSSGKSMEKHTRSAVDLPELLSPADSFHSLALKSLGAVDRRAAFHSEQFIFPVGYRVSGKLVASSGDATEFVFDIAEHNAEEEAAPMFRIFSKSILKRCVVGNSAETTWRDFIAMISSDAEMALRKIRGVSVLGLDQPAVRIAIEAMDKDRVCTLYWKGRENVLKAVCQAENLFDKVSQRMRDRAMTLSQLIAETGLYNLLPSSKRPTHASNYQDQVEVLRDWISSNNSSGLTGLGKSSFIHEQANRKEVDTGKDISNELSSVVRDGPRTRSSVLPRPPSRLKRKSPSTRSRSQTSDFSIENDQKSNEIGSRNLPDGFFDVGNRVDAKDCNGVWYPATIVSSTGRKVLVNFDGWSDDWNEWISKRLVSGSSARLTTIGTFSSSVKVMRISSPKKNTPLKSSRSKRQRNESWTTTAAPQLENFQKEDPASQIPNTLSNNEPTIVSTVDAQTSQNLSTKISTLLDENSWLTWDEEAVLKWMRLPDVNLGAHCDLFLSKNIAGTMFKYLDDNALKCHVGITSRFERKKILLKLKELMDGSAALPKDAHFQWDIEAVTLYLSSRPYKVDKNEFYEAFKAHGVDGSCLSCLTKEILVEEFGINILFVESLLLKIRLVSSEA